MGEHTVVDPLEGERLRRFSRRLLAELRALEEMLATGRIQSGVRRIGAEQELFLVDADGRPAPRALEVLQVLENPQFTTEIGLFNLEFNLEPLLFGGDCLRRLEARLAGGFRRARNAAARCQAEVLLTGILPTLRKSDLALANMTPAPRYRGLNDALGRLRRGPYELRIKGIDELQVQHDSVMFEACNTSFQVHLQVGPEEFARFYNAAQAAAAPVLAAAVNSPLLFGRRLWHETRIAVFQQAMDTRRSSDRLRERRPRVTFGNAWVRESVVELFREDVARFRSLIGADVDDDPFEQLRQGAAPELKALLVHNSTVYRWNRPCYGITDGEPHLRIENRMLAAGPTLLDQVANAAFWLGLVIALAARRPEVPEALPFEHVRANFSAAARHGLLAQLTWLDGRTAPAGRLVAELLPLAREGLDSQGIDPADAERYLAIVAARVASGRTGAQWLLDSYAALRRRGTIAERLAALTGAMRAPERKDLPGHEWPLARIEEAGGWERHVECVEQYLNADFVTVREDEPLELAASLMEWERIDHLPVEGLEDRLVGMVSRQAVLQRLATSGADPDGSPLPVSAVMQRRPPRVAPETRTAEALELMRANALDCLPVVQGDRLVGTVTQRDLAEIAAEILAREGAHDAGSRDGAARRGAPGKERAGEVPEPPNFSGEIER